MVIHAGFAFTMSGPGLEIGASGKITPGYIFSTALRTNPKAIRQDPVA
jgi:hypothetical protein